MDPREQRGLEIAAKLPIKRQGDVFIVPSQSGRGKYQVNPDPQFPRCNCPDFELRHKRCKHIFAVEYSIQREMFTDGETTTVTETRTVKVTYSQDWPAYNEAQTKEKALFQSLLFELCKGIAEPAQTIGRPRLPLADMIFSSAFKVYSTVSMRRFMSDLHDAHGKGYISKLPCYNSIFNYLESEALTPALKALIIQSSLPLKAIESDFAVDSSGFSTSRFVRWFDAKYGKEMSQHDWVKVHLMCGVKTNIVTAVDISHAYANDSPFFRPLVRQTAENFDIKEVSADKAYLSNYNLVSVGMLDATPYIPFKSSSSGNGTVYWEKMWGYFTYHKDEFLAHYHKRSNVETTFSMIKAKFGDSLRSKTDTALTNEALCKVLAHNLCCVIQSMFEFGIEPLFQAA